MRVEWSRHPCRRDLGEDSCEGGGQHVACCPFWTGGSRRRHNRRWIAWGMAVLVPCLSSCVTAVRFDHGDGTEANPYRVSAASELMSIGSCPSLLDKHFILAADIDMAECPRTSAVIAPAIDGRSVIDGPAFVGTFDGAGYKIINLTINTLADGDPNNDGDGILGLFGIIGPGGQVRNLGVENVTVVGGKSGLRRSSHLGGLCGYNLQGIIDKCYVTGRVQAETGCHHFGGLCGENWGGVLRHSYTAVRVTGGDAVEKVGGLCGFNDSGTIDNCHAVGVVSTGNDSDYVGGLCGATGSDGIDIGTIRRSYATATVTSGDNSRFLGGLCGGNDNGGIDSGKANVTNSYATGSVRGGANCSSAGGLCGINSGKGMIVGCYATGSLVFASSTLCTRNLGGLCGENRNGTISRCFAAGNITAGESAVALGGLCGVNEGQILACFATGNVSAGDGSEALGGLCGWNHSNAITDCYATGHSSAGKNSKSLGGLCGWNSGDISNCYAVGQVRGGRGSEWLGGLCGRNSLARRSVGRIANCFWDIDMSNVKSSAGGKGLPTTQMQLLSTFADAGWDFAEDDGDAALWKMGIGRYPQLAWE